MVAALVKCCRIGQISCEILALSAFDHFQNTILSSYDRLTVTYMHGTPHD